MTAMTTAPRFINSSAPIAGELLDALIEAVVLPPDGRARAAVICSLVQEMCASVEWLQDSDTGTSVVAQTELSSIRRLADAADDHRLRMSDFSEDAAGGGTR